MPYKLSRLKKIYLLLLITTIFTVSLYATKTVFSFVTGKNDNEEEYIIIEKGAVGDEGPIDVNETMDYPFEIHWNDTDYESNRPSSVTYNLYNVLDENTIVSTVTLTPSNVDSSDSNKWLGTFENVNKYNQDETKASYIIKQQQINNYVQKYDKKLYDGLCIRFGSNINTNAYSPQIYYYDKDENKNYFFIDNNNNYDLSRSWLLNNKICMSVKMDNPEIYLYYGFSLDIQEIYPVYNESYRSVYRSWNPYKKDTTFYGSHYPDSIYFGASSAYKYIWEANKNNFPNSDVIINEINITKYDYTHYVNISETNSNLNTITYKLFNGNELIDSKTTNSIESRLDEENKLTGSFTNLVKYDSDLNEIEYNIEVIANDKTYVTTYDVDFEYNGLCVEFGDTNTSSYNDYMYFATKDEDGDYYIALDSVTKKYTTWFYKSEVNNSRICSVTTMDSNDIYIIEPGYIIFKNIYPVYKKYYSLPYWSSNFSYIQNELEGDNFPGGTEYSNSVHYTWKPHSRSFPNSNVFVTEQEKTSISFDMYWEDEGLEELRPSSSEFYLYRKTDSNKIIATVKLDESNLDPNDNYHWIGKFENVPLYDDEGNEAEYVVRREQNDDYQNFTDGTGGVVIKFNDQVAFTSDEQLRVFIWNPQYRYWSSYWYTYSRNGVGYLNDSKIVDLTFENTSNVRYGGDELYQESNYIGQSSFNNYIELYGDNYPETLHPVPYYDYYVWYYKTTPTKHGQELRFHYHGDSWGNMHGVEIDSIEVKGHETIVTAVINKKQVSVTKIWEDEGYENERPDSVTLKIYDSKELNHLVKEVTIDNTNQIDDHTWKKEYTLPKYREDGSECEYYIKEEIDNYVPIYDKPSEYNGLEVIFSDDSQMPLEKICSHLVSGTTYSCSSNVSKYKGTKSYPYSVSYIKNRTIVIPRREFYLQVSTYYMNQYEDNPVGKIISIVPVKTKSYWAGQSSNWNIGIKVSNHTKDDYYDYEDFKNIDDYLYHYYWSGSYTPLEGDVVITNKINKMNYEITKKWEDTGLEDKRPQSVTFNLYNELDENIIVSTITLTSNNKNPNNSNEWIGSFENIPAYNEDGSEAKYLVKEQEQNLYKVKYDTKEYNGFCVVFSDYFLNGYRNNYFDVMVKDSDNKYRRIQNINNPDYQYNYAYRCNMIDREMCFRTNKKDFYVSYYSTDKIPIVDKIYPVYRDDYIFMESTAEAADTRYYNWYEVSGDDFNHLAPSSYGNSSLHYTWKGLDHPYEGADIITNIANMREGTYVKEFNDEGNEYNRPSSIVFGLYEENDPVPKEMATLDTSTCENNKCNITFKNVKDKDSDGNQIKYEIKEISDYGYDVSYDNSSSKDDYNSLCVRFGSQVFINYQGMRIQFKDGETNRIMKVPSSDYTYFGEGSIANKTICIPTPTTPEIIFSGYTAQLDIQEIYPSHIEYDESMSIEGSVDVYDMIEYKGSDLPPNLTGNHAIKYTYTDFTYSYKVINTAHPVDVKFRKENVGHDILRGAKFEIYNKSGDKITEFTSKDTETTIKLLPSEYTIKEVEAPSGYTRSQDITFTVNENGTVVIDGKTENVVNIVNEPLKEKYDITIKKTLKTNETKDFKFEITIEDFNGTLEYTGDRGGTITFNNNKATVNIGYNQTITIKDIPVNSVYEIKELGDDYLITIKGNNKGTLDRNENIEFINTPKEIPANGEEKEVPAPITGVLNILSYIAGILLLIGSIFLIVYSKKQLKKS